MKTVILGTGSWGTALGQVLADNHQEVVMWGRDQTEVNDINLQHRNSRFFATEINEALKASDDMSIVKDADILLLAVPTNAMESVLQQAIGYLSKPVIVINVAKGFHPVSHKRLSQVIQETMPEGTLKAVVSLIGPSHAEEVIIRKLTVINAVSDNEEAAVLIQKMFSNEYFRVYTNNDVTGAEIGVALKNIMAIASGVLEGVGQGDNAKAALITRGLAEMTRFGVLLGGRQETFLGLDGVGDLIVTCTSRHSRNFMSGYEIGKAGGAAEFMKNNTKTVEGIFACKVVHEEAMRLGIEMPITDQVYAVLYENKDPHQAISELMARDLKKEGKGNYKR